MELLNNREISLLFWFIISLGWGLSNKDVRKALHNLLVAAFAKALVKMYGFMLAYILLCVYGLYEIGLWDFGLAKTTLIWIFSAALVTLFRHKQIREDPDYFKNAIKDNISLIVAIEFIVTFYSFHVLVELVFVPVSVIVVGVYTTAKLKEETKIVADFLDKASVPFGFLVLAYAMHNLLAHAGEFFSVSTLTDFLIPIVLSILFLPFVYLVAVYASYERVYEVIKRNTSNPDILKYAKLKSLLAFHLRFKLLERWAHYTFFNQLDSKEARRAQ